MQALRTASTLARLVLVMFALSLGAAAASPLFKRGAIELVCSGGGMKWQSTDSDSHGGSSGSIPDCPLCVSPGAPPPVVTMAGKVAAPSLAPRPFCVASPLARAATGPLPARGPPALVPL